MNLAFDYSNMINNQAFGEGIDLEHIDASAEIIKSAYNEVFLQRGKGWYGWCDLPYRDQSEIADIIAYANSIRQHAKSFVVFGIGGSALGTLAVATALLHARHNELDESRRNAPKFYVEDNVDPERMNSLLDIIDLETTHYNFITKSGETSETLSQFFIIYNRLVRALGSQQAAERMTVTTTIGKGSLYEIAKGLGLRVFDVEKGVGGRFSVFSCVGLLPFAVLGLDIRRLLEGAADMSLHCLNADIYQNPALMSAFLHISALKKGKNISVMMPYADSLRFMSDFFAQLWGESLGKEFDKSGNTIRCGQTPVKALGVTDQHSQIQLYVQGPQDKIVTLLAVEKFRNDILIPREEGIHQGDFLAGHTLGRLINSERVATTFALRKAGCPSFTISLGEIDEPTIGALLMYFMYQTAYAGALLGIDAFDQPGVEEGKKATFAILGRRGYEQKMNEIQAQAHQPLIIKL